MHAQQRAVALGFEQLDAVHQFTAGDIDLIEHLLEQHRARQQGQCPVLCIAAQGQLEVPLQSAAVALQHGEEQAVLLGAGALAREHLPTGGIPPGNAFVGNAVILL
ncbi:hypothetical protein D3C87_1784240 [compost metagenome]